MEALVYTFLLVSTLGIIFSLFFFGNRLQFQIKNEIIFHSLH
uniref:Uncharacterized protein n=1 Tax=Brassica oleracea TaxID=3712 RepID=A0A3P6ERD9_BRAOL|nr:unnamed protein product [Brassica oleracea]